MLGTALSFPPTGEILRETDLSFTEWDGDGTAIVDLDTGVDAGHPDYDYLEPWTGEKTLYSAKYGPVIPVRNPQL